MSAKRETVAERVVGKFGGLSPTAKALGHKNVTTVQGWLERGHIHPRNHPDLFKAAKKQKIDLKPEDFFVGLPVR